MALVRERRNPGEILSRLSHLNVTGKISKDAVLKAGGGSSDVYQSKWLSDGKLVAVRKMREHLYPPENQAELKKNIALELRIWSDLHHNNILPLLGYTYDFGDNPACVTEWMSNGTVLQFLKNHPNADRLEMIKGIAAGIEYLHSKEVVHSDIKTENIVVASNGKPLLLDFGNSCLLEVSRVITTTKDMGCGTYRWMAFELLQEHPGTDTYSSPPRVAKKETDVWAFGMTVLEIITDAVPYSDIARDIQVVPVISSGRLPKRPIARRDIDDVLWDLCNKCWNLNPASRPTMANIPTEIDALINGSSNKATSQTKMHELLDGTSSDTDLFFDLSVYPMLLYKREFISPSIYVQSRLALSPCPLRQKATDPPTTRICIAYAGLAPFAVDQAWKIVIEHPSAITVGEVLKAIHTSLRTPITQHEWARFTADDISTVTRGYNQRCNSSQSISQIKKRALRVDVLGKNHMFAGLRKKEGNTFELRVKRKREVVKTHTA